MTIFSQAVIAFDEMSLNGTIAYDSTLDQIYGPCKNLMVVIARGIFADWKIPVFYGYDTKFKRSHIDHC